MSQTLSLTKVHVYKVRPNQPALLVKENHYVRLCADGGPPHYVQGGTVFGEGGPMIPNENLPAWFWREAEKVSDAVKNATGLVRLLADHNDPIAEVLEEVTEEQALANDATVAMEGMESNEVTVAELAAKNWKGA